MRGLQNTPAARHAGHPMKVSDPFFIVGEAIRLKIEQYGSLRAAAKVLRVSAPYLCRFRHGHKRNPNDKLLRRLGVVREVSYRWRSDKGS